VVALKEKLVRCGRAGCPSCPHGPYLYEYTWRNGKTHCKYLGKMTAAEYRTNGVRGEEEEVPDNIERLPVNNPANNYFVCLDVLGLEDGIGLTREVLRKRVNGLVRRDADKADLVGEMIEAYAYLCHSKGWEAPKRVAGIPVKPTTKDV